MLQVLDIKIHYACQWRDVFQHQSRGISIILSEIKPRLNACCYHCCARCWQIKNMLSPLSTMAAILKTIFSDAFSWLKSFLFWLEFHTRFQWIITSKVFICQMLHEYFDHITFYSANIQTENPGSLVYIMDWRQMGDKPLSEPMLTHFTDEHMWH